ncbi:glycoside hydrolase superfamily [Aspergillus egyptiacus]|nr:glycoside hydrolase superfamily [Aspergillus egyptiacus]
MKLWHTTISAVAAAGLASCSIAQDWPLHDNGLNKVVEWDHYSLKVNGERLFLWSGELHLWRIPVPELWRDIFQKVKAAGFNGVALYEHWGWHAPNNETLDFETGAHAFAKCFEIAKELGLYITYRPGPYSNAEANGGGFPGWLTTGQYGPLRDNNTEYTKAWKRYSGAVVDYVHPYLITNGGPIILWQLENEYGHQWLDPETKVPNATAISYMELLQESHREWGVDVPVTHNNPSMWTRSWSKDYSSVGGEVDVYGLDHYPACWTCNLEQCTAINGNVEPYTVFNYYDHFQEVSPTQPSFLMEFQGGSYNPWDGPAGGCSENMGPSWVNLFFRHNLAQKVSAVNIYMLYGGTNWDNIGFPEVGTSYDYSAPIHQTRQIGDKYSESKLFGLFMRVARDFTKVDRVGYGTEYATDRDIFTTELRNPDTGSAFYVIRHDYSPSTEVTRFRLNVSTQIGDFSVPSKGSITLNGRESKVLVTDFCVGSSGKVITYATLEILTVADLGDRQVVVFWAPEGEFGEYLLQGAKSGRVVSGSANRTTVRKTSNGVVTNVATSETMTVIDYSSDVETVVVGRQSAYKFWAPALDNNPLAWENSTVLVHGPYLVRSAEIKGSTIHISGDWDVETPIEIWAPKNVKHVIFNGSKLNVTQSAYGSLKATLPASTVTIDGLAAQLPPLTHWKVAEDLPEKAAEYDDSNWTNADHMDTPHFVPPDTYPVLFADEYGYQAGNILWRGRFDAGPGEAPTGAYLRVIGGLASGFSAYLNGHFLGSWLGSMSNKTGELHVSFQADQLRSQGDNVLFVIQDTMGKQQREGAPDPRGILNATLIAADGTTAAKFSSWKVAGNAGGNHLLEPVRGTYNEGGLHAERLGWHLPGFDDSDWEAGLPADGFIGADARFYRTVVPLDIPEGYDASSAFELRTAERAKLRAQLYVNGYQFAKTLPYISNEITFPVFPGILNYNGDNTIGLSVWTMEEAGGAVDVAWKVIGVHQSGFDPRFESDYLRPGWEDRSQYA